MKIFITGIDGVLGSTLKNKLRSQGHDVFGCSLTHSNDPAILRADVSEYRQLESVLNRFAPRSLHDRFDLLYHFAAEFGRNNGRDFPEQLWKSNCVGTHNVIQECVLRSTRMVFASSSEAYGLSEEYAGDRLLHESMLDDSPPQFHNEYALTKYTNERQITMAVRNQGLKAIILRFFNIYGPPERYSPYRSVVCQLAYKMLAGQPIIVNRGGFRTHLWIGDWANTVSNIADYERLYRIDHERSLPTGLNHPWPGAGNTLNTPVFNIGAYEYESVEGLYLKLAALIPNSKSLVQFTDKEKANTATKRPSIMLAQRMLNHDPSTPFMIGLRTTVEWLKKEYGF